ncbi:hypothetical protein DFH09DRAFT_1336428 [Mycena vulgaris]|nr:hypothetical protein DFH09DRAFT_1336428 [Mycena vulgaris]
MDAPESQDPGESAPTDVPETQKPENAHWSRLDVETMLKYLVENKAAAGEGCNFKVTTYQKLLPIINAVLSRGAPKTVKSCQNKFNNDLKKKFRVIQDIQGQSGFHWDNVTGASIDVASSPAWDTYIKRAPDAKPFRNRGWRYLSQMEQMMPRVAKGTNVFRASQAVVQASGGDDSQEEDDIEETSPPRRVAEDTAPRRRRAPSLTVWDIETDGAPLPSGDDDESVRGSTPAPATPMSTRKRPATPTPHRQKKQPRLSGGARALENLANSAVDFNEIMTGIGTSFAAATAAAAPGTAPAPAQAETTFHTTPHRKINAAKRAQRLEKWLGTTNLIIFLDLLRNDISMVDTYSALEEDDEELRREWVKTQVAKHVQQGVQDFDFNFGSYSM